MPATDSFGRDLLGVEQRKKLREAFADPLLVVVLARDCLPPELVRQFVGEEVLREVLEGHRVACPGERGARHRLVQQGEIRRAVTARQRVLGQREPQERERQIVHQVAVEAHDVGRRVEQVPGA